MNLASRGISQTAAALVLGLAANSVLAYCPPPGYVGTEVKYPDCPISTLSIDDPDGGGPAPVVYEAPDPVWMNCEGSGDGMFCESWPQSDDPLITYAYNASGSIRIPYPTTSPYISVSCWKGGHGTLTVTVYHGVPGNRAGTSTTQGYYCPY